MFASVVSFAQQHSVNGTVKDQNGQPVIGLTVLEQGTKNGVITNADGRYDITVSSSEAVLEFSSLGYSTVTEKVGGRAVINVDVHETAIALDAVVAIGYGSVRKKDLTTAVSTVNTEDMALRPVTDASGFIQGKVSGVQVTQTSGQPGSGMVIRVRGASSISSTNDPLYVVDGVPVGTGNYAISYLSPNDIETMQILKDASSAAIYGSTSAPTSDFPTSPRPMTSSMWTSTANSRKKSEWPMSRKDSKTKQTGLTRLTEPELPRTIRFQYPMPPTSHATT